MDRSLLIIGVSGKWYGVMSSLLHQYQESRGEEHARIERVMRSNLREMERQGIVKGVVDFYRKGLDLLISA